MSTYLRFWTLSMKLHELSPITRYLFLLIGQILLVVLCIGCIEFIYYRDILPDKVVSETYIETQCTIVDEQVEKRGKIVPLYRANFLINYTSTEGNSYNTWVSGNGLDQTFSTDKTMQEDVLDEYDIGQVYPCWYNPQAPEIAVLVLRQSWASTFPLFIPSVILLIVLYFVWRTVSQLLEAIAEKKQEHLNQRKK